MTTGAHGDAPAWRQNNGCVAFLNDRRSRYFRVRIQCAPRAHREIMESAGMMHAPHAGPSRLESRGGIRILAGQWQPAAPGCAQCDYLDPAARIGMQEALLMQFV